MEIVSLPVAAPFGPAHSAGMNNLHRAIVDTVLDAPTPEARRASAKRIVGMAFAALVAKDGPDALAEMVNEFSKPVSAE